METNKIIILPILQPNSTSTIHNNNKKIEKQIVKRQITTTPKWIFSDTDLQPEQQVIHIYDITKQSFIYQQIRNKLSSYRSQDMEKKIFNPENIMDVSGVIQKLEEAKFSCFYCKSVVYILYDNVREPRQWTLERLDNKKGHIYDNVEIACLSCNLRRRTMKYEKYILTKQIQRVVKVEGNTTEFI
jgi:5-methylcytosine-specific restriction endonuclease McrA